MEENTKGGNNRSLITILITLIILVVVAVIYWDRQNQRNFQQSQAEIKTGLIEEWGPQSQQQVNLALGAMPVAFSKQVSYKDIVAMVAPSVVSVNVGSSFINQGGPVIQPQPVVGNQGGHMAGYLYCPNCYTTVPCWKTAQRSMVNCPSCGMGMIRGDMPQRPAVAGQLPTVQNLPADQSQGPMWLGRYVLGGRMGPGGLLVCPNCSTQVPHQRGMPAYAVSCPNCATQMMRQGAPGSWPSPTDVQQIATPQNDNQFQALGRGGSGVIINSRGYVLTNHHVVHGARNITVILSHGQITKTYRPSPIGPCDWSAGWF